MMNYLLPLMLVFSLFCAIATGKISELSASVVTGGTDAISLAIKLAGVICLWNGLTAIAQKSGLTALICRILSPFLNLLFPKLKDKKAKESIAMNVTANFLGLGNAATPLGLEAMKRLQEVNPTPEKATNEMVRFVVINSAAVHLVPTTIALLRSEYGSSSPMEILFPALATSITALSAGILATQLLKKVFK